MQLCPFCGNIPTVVIVHRNEDYVVCETPLCAIEGEYVATIESWNNRYNKFPSFDDFIDELYECGWKSTSDAQLTNIIEFYDKIAK